jgi:hypothetical protein
MTSSKAQDDGTIRRLHSFPVLIEINRNGQVGVA